LNHGSRVHADNSELLCPPEGGGRLPGLTSSLHIVDTRTPNTPCCDTCVYCATRTEDRTLDEDVFGIPYGVPNVLGQPQERQVQDAGFLDVPARDTPVFHAPAQDAGFWDAPAQDVPFWDAPAHDVPLWDASFWNAPVWDAPAQDTQAVQGPQDDQVGQAAMAEDDLERVSNWLLTVPTHGLQQALHAALGRGENVDMAAAASNAAPPVNMSPAATASSRTLSLGPSKLTSDI
jgi:hypothetical protein